MAQDPARHFDSVASDYNRYRTTDKEPIDWLVQAAPDREHTLCDLGCGTARYGFALADRLREIGNPVRRLVGVDTSKEMLGKARAESAGHDLECEWLLASSERTGMAPQSVTLSISFNSIHYLPFADTLSEVCRSTEDGGHLAVYTRLREQEEEHVWGAWFPGYTDYSLVPSREEMEEVPSMDSRFMLEACRDFRYPRESTFSWISEQTGKKFYSTFDRYSEDDFRRSYQTFLKDLRSNYENLDRIAYWSSYSIWLYRVAGTKGET